MFLSSASPLLPLEISLSSTVQYCLPYLNNHPYPSPNPLPQTRTKAKIFHYHCHCHHRCHQHSLSLHPFSFFIITPWFFMCIITFNKATKIIEVTTFFQPTLTLILSPVHLRNTSPTVGRGQIPRPSFFTLPFSFTLYFVFTLTWLIHLTLTLDN